MYSPLTIVTYHYVRDPEKGLFKNFKTLRIDEFKQQIGYLKRFYTFLNYSQLRVCIKNPKENPFPNNSILLTFDDGLIDHYTNVLPVLLKNKIQGFFFVPSAPLNKTKLLNVHKIHLLLNFISDINLLIQEVDKFIIEPRNKSNLESINFYKKTWMKKNPYDTKEVMYVKGMLQSGLPEVLRNYLLNQIFSKYVSKDEKEFIPLFYLTQKQLINMINLDMYIGPHGDSHNRLNYMPVKTQILEILNSLSFMKKIGSPSYNWIFSYPYGAFNITTINLATKYGAMAGLTTNPGIALVSKNNNMVLSRLDTNEFPKIAYAKPNNWTRKVLNV